VSRGDQISSSLKNKKSDLPGSPPLRKRKHDEMADALEANEARQNCSDPLFQAILR
jgi:hypothetical protein